MFFKTKSSDPVAPPVAERATGGFMSAPLAAVPVAISGPTLQQQQTWATEEANLGVTFLRIARVLMRSPFYRTYSLSDLEWLVLPALQSGQCAVLQSTATATLPPEPAAIALWACVSPEVDQRLSTELAAPIRLRPDEWRSGDILWLIDAVGQPQAIEAMMAQLQAGAFQGREVRARSIGADGKAIVSVLRGA